MHSRQAIAYARELELARALLAQGELDAAHSHLERAHVIGQAHAGAHMRVHARMLALEWRRRRPLAVLGQAVRIVLGGLGSAVGVVPTGNTGNTGNTGGSDISMFKRLPVAPELQALIDDRASDEAGAPITRPPQQP